MALSFSFALSAAEIVDASDATVSRARVSSMVVSNGWKKHHSRELYRPIRVKAVEHRGSVYVRSTGGGERVGVVGPRCACSP